MQKVIWAIVALLLISVAAVGFATWRRPLAVAALLHRRELTKGGFKKASVATCVGKEVMFVGGNGPTIVLLHGAGDQAGAWSKVATALLSRYRVIVPDLPGHGESEPKEGPLSLGTVLRGVQDIVDQQPGKVILVGNSLGGWIASLYAHQRLEKVERLVLVNGGPLMGDRPDITLTPRNREEARKTIAAMFDPGSFQLPDYVVDDIVRESQTGPLMRLSQTAGEMPKYLLEGKLHEIAVPVNLIWGESDQVVSVEYAKRMLADLPNAQLTTLPRCGHAPALECPKAFTAKLIEALQSPVVPAVESTGAQAK